MEELMAASRKSARIYSGLAALALIATIAPLTGTPANAAQASAAAVSSSPVNNYPYKSSASGKVDRWNFYTRQCTSFAAWRITHNLGLKFKNSYKGQTFGNANNWDNAAKRAGLKVNSTATVGSIAQFESNHHAGAFGHVAYVYKVSGSYVYLEEYNFNTAKGYGTRKIAKSSVSHFIHFK
jgi:surface antigen